MACQAAAQKPTNSTAAVTSSVARSGLSSFRYSSQGGWQAQRRCLQDRGAAIREAREHRRQVHPGLHRQPLVLQRKSSSSSKAAKHASHLHPCR